jgi:hypothetical protein
MRKEIGATLVALPFLIIAPARALAGKHTVPARVVQARSVALGYDLGDRFLSDSAAVADPGVLPDERRALKAIRDEMQRWGRYVVKEQPREADLLIAVRLGRPGDFGAGTEGSGILGGPGGMRRGSSYGGGVSSSDDMLAVYDCVEGRVGKRMWRERKAGGLAGQPPVLFSQFRADVERTEEPAKK